MMVVSALRRDSNGGGGVGVSADDVDMRHGLPATSQGWLEWVSFWSEPWGQLAVDLPEAMFRAAYRWWCRGGVVMAAPLGSLQGHGLSSWTNLKFCLPLEPGAVLSLSWQTNRPVGNIRPRLPGYAAIPSVR